MYIQYIYSNSLVKYYTILCGYLIKFVIGILLLYVCMLYYIDTPFHFNGYYNVICIRLQYIIHC